MSTILLRRRRLGRGSCRGISEKSTTGIRVCRSWLMGQDRPPERDDLVIRWGCTTSVESDNVLNTARAIHQVNDKAGFRMLLQENTGNDELVPYTFTEMSAGHYAIIADEGVVMRPATHSRGRNLHLCQTADEARAAVQQCGEGWYASEYIEKVAEYRVFVVQGRAVAVAEKTPANREDIAWNVAQGGRFDNVAWDNWPLQAVRKSIEAFNLSKLDFGGVDVMVDADGKAYVIEINSAPSLTSDYRQECMAKVFDWIVANGKERIPMIEERGGYRKFIHPAVCDRSIVPDALTDDAFIQGGGMLGYGQEEEPTDEEMDEMNAGEILGEMSIDETITLRDFTDQQLLDEMDRRMGG